MYCIYMCTCIYVHEREKPYTYIYVCVCEYNKLGDIHVDQSMLHVHRRSTLHVVCLH